MKFVEGAGPKEYKRMAIDAIQDLPDDCAMGYLNPLLEDIGSTSRIRIALAFVSEVLLHGHEGRDGHITDDMTPEAMEGAGWIIHSCHTALELHDELARAKWFDRGQIKAVE